MRKVFFAVAGLFLLLYILPLGVRPMIIPDEPRYAEIPREMIASGDWVVPRLNGLRYFEKPVMGYWMNAVSILIFGENNFAIRFSSAISAGLSALMLFMLLRRFAGGSLPGILAAAIFLTCFEVFAIGTFNILDSMLSMLLTGSMVSFFFAHIEIRTGKRVFWLAMFGIFAGLAFLTKGFLAFAVPVVAIVPFMIWEGRWKALLFRLPWIPIIAALLTALPWSVMIHLRESDFWNYFFWTEHVRRFLSDNAQHAEPFWFFILVIAGGALPWTALLPAAVPGLKSGGFKAPVLRFLICWFLFPFLFFSASKGKLPTYILPCFPPFAALMAVGFLNYFEKGKEKAFRISAVFFAVIVGIIAIIIVGNQLTGFPGIRAYGPSETWKWLLGTSGILIWSGMIVFSARISDFRKKLILYSAAPLLFMFSAHFIIPDKTRDKKAPGKFFMSQASDIWPDTVIISHETVTGAACWFYKRADLYLLADTGEFKYGLSYEDSKHRLSDADNIGQIIRKAHGENCAVLVSKAKNYKEYISVMPEPASEDSDGGFVLVRFCNER
ncbi:phospholipid carrier-dependent glycosyltransferase [Desulfococcaceae bacterium HSG8]|nr:phospholipid carrier-dependent glycosyltransferase [Desulfococcaceae bacterium HSG8]